MTLRKVQTVSDAAHTGFAAVIYRDSEWNEFRARLAVDGVADRDSDSFADTKEQAIRDGMAMIAHAARQRDRLAVVDGTATIVADARTAADRNRLPVAVCWIDGLCLRGIMSESAERFGIVTILPANYFA